jgi:hypothetical protein
MRRRIDSAQNSKGGNMRKQSFIALVAVTAALLAVPLTSASAGDYDSGYNTGDTDTLTIGSDPYTGGPTQEDYDAMQSIQQGAQDLKDNQGAAPDDLSPDDSTDVDDSSGH